MYGPDWGQIAASSSNKDTNMHISYIYRLGIDQASIPAFSSKIAIADIRPRNAAMWSREVCSSFKEKVMSSPIFIQVEAIREGTVLARARWNADGFFLDAWLVFTNHAYLNSPGETLFSYLEVGFDIFQ